MKRCKTAIIGAGFIGRVHVEALRQVEFLDIVAIGDSNRASAEELASRYAIKSLDPNEILHNSEIDAVHICVPNTLHYTMAKEALLASKHVICEKPLAVTKEEAVQLVSLAQQRKLRNCVAHTLRYYPMVQQIRRMREDGDLGEILIVQGTYSQDWLQRETDWNWRIDAQSGGPSRTMADIGSHWFDLVEYLTGIRISSLCADLQTFHKIRKRPRRSVETFENKLQPGSEYIPTPVETEDFGAVLFSLGESARGAVTASQVSAGRKNQLRVEIYGTKSGVAWDGEQPNELWIGHRDSPNQVLIKDPSLLKDGARSFASLPGGHCEGYADTFREVFRRFYASIRDTEKDPEYPQFSDGLRQLLILRAEMESNRSRSWVDVPAE